MTVGILDKVKEKSIVFKEGEFIIIYIPHLNLSAYGDTIEEAESMLQVCLDEIPLEELNSNVTDGFSFEELGWDVIKPK